MTQLVSGLWWQSMPELHVVSSDTRKHAKAPKTPEQRPSTCRPLGKQYKLVLEDIHGRSHCHHGKGAGKAHVHTNSRGTQG